MTSPLTVAQEVADLKERLGEAITSNAQCAGYVDQAVDAVLEMLDKEGRLTWPQSTIADMTQEEARLAYEGAYIMRGLPVPEVNAEALETALLAERYFHGTSSTDALRTLTDGAKRLLDAGMTFDEWRANSIAGKPSTVAEWRTIATGWLKALEDTRAEADNLRRIITRIDTTYDNSYFTGDLRREIHSEAMVTRHGPPSPPGPQAKEARS